MATPGRVPHPNPPSGWTPGPLFDLEVEILSAERLSLCTTYGGEDSLADTPGRMSLESVTSQLAHAYAYVEVVASTESKTLGIPLQSSMRRDLVQGRIASVGVAVLDDL